MKDYTKLAPKHDKYYGQKDIKITKDYPKKDEIWIALSDYAIIQRGALAPLFFVLTKGVS